MSLNIPGATTAGTDAAASMHSSNGSEANALGMTAVDAPEAAHSPLIVAYVTNMVPPYLSNVFEYVGSTYSIALTALCCTEREPNREWIVPPAKLYSRITLSGLRIHLNYTRHIYLSLHIFSELARLNPDVVITAGFSPTMIFAAAWAKLKGRPYGIATDGWLETDPGRRSWIHRILRRCMIPPAAFGIGGSALSVKLLAHYGMQAARLSVMQLVPTIAHPEHAVPLGDRPFDLLWCGRIDDDTKGIKFFVECARRLRARRGTLRVRLAGSGPLREWAQAALANADIFAEFDGFIQAQQLAEFYGSGRIFMFPSRGDAWGLVVSEAVIAGTPTIASNKSASGIVLSQATDGVFCEELDVDKWVGVAERLLSQPSLWNSGSQSNFQFGKTITAEEAAAVFVRTIEACRSGRHP